MHSAFSSAHTRRTLHARAHAQHTMAHARFCSAASPHRLHQAWSKADRCLMSDTHWLAATHPTARSCAHLCMRACARVRASVHKHSHVRCMQSVPECAAPRSGTFPHLPTHQQGAAPGAAGHCSGPPRPAAAAAAVGRALPLPWFPYAMCSRRLPPPPAVRATGLAAGARHRPSPPPRCRSPRSPRAILLPSGVLAAGGEEEPRQQRQELMTWPGDQVL